MFKNHFKTVFRNLWKHKTFSLVNILGFAFSCAVCLAILLFIMNERSYDNYHENIDNLYRLTSPEKNTSGIDYRVKDLLVDNYVEIEDACICYQLNNEFGISYENNAVLVNNLLSADNDFFNVFTIPFVNGNPANPLPNINSVVLTESSAKLLFKDEDPLSKEVLLWNCHHLIVSAVIKDFPENSSINADVICNADNDNFKFCQHIGNGDDISTYRYYFNIYLHLNDMVKKNEFIAKVNQFPDIMQPYENLVDLLAVKDMYLKDNTSGCTTKKGNLDLLNLLSAIAIIVLILAIVNYINLTAAQQNRRNREIGVRKTIGANRYVIITQFLTESVIIILIAWLLSLMILEALLPVFSAIIDSHLDLEILFKLPVLVYIICSIIGIGILSGIGPALLFSSFNPIRILRGGISKSGKRNHFRTGLTIFQFTTSIVLIICLLVIFKQINFAKHHNLGFYNESILSLSINGEDEVQLLKEKLLKYPGIIKVCKTNGRPGDINFRLGDMTPSGRIMHSVISADSNFVETFGVKIIRGRNLLPGEYGTVCFINETGFKAHEWENLDNKNFENGRECGFDIIGVVEDFHIGPMYKTVNPTLITFTEDAYFNHLTVRIVGGSIRETMVYIKDTWKDVFPNSPLKYEFYDDWIDAMYRKEESFA